MTCRAYIDGYWWDYAVSVDLQHHYSAQLLSKLIPHHRCLRTIQMQDKIPRSNDFKRFMELAGSQLTSMTWTEDDIQSDPPQQSDSLFCQSFQYLDPNILGHFSTPKSNWGNSQAELYPSAVKNLFSVPFPRLQSATFTEWKDLSTIAKVGKHSPALQCLEIKFGKVGDLEETFAVLRRLADLRRTTLKKIDVQYRYLEETSAIHKALGLKPDLNLSAADYEDNCVARYAVPIKNFVFGDGNVKVWHEQANLVGRGSLRQIDDVFDACFPEAHEAMEALCVILRSKRNDAKDLPYMCDKVESLLLGLDLTQTAHLEVYFKLESSLFTKVLNNNLPKLRKKVLQRLLPILAKDNGLIEVGAVVRRDVETRWGLLYKGLDMYYIPIQLRGYITIGWSTGPNRGCLPHSSLLG
jgi:hypothetical protein